MRQYGEGVETLDKGGGDLAILPPYAKDCSGNLF